MGGFASHYYLLFKILPNYHLQVNLLMLIDYIFFLH